MTKITPGPWKQGKTNPCNVSAGSSLVCKTFNRGQYNEDTAEANACLIAEAGTVAHKTGFTPRQLAEQRAELVEALKDCVGYMEASAERDLNDWQTLEPTKRKAKEKLERAKKYRSIIATFSA